MWRFRSWIVILPVCLLALLSPANRVKADALGNWVYSQSCVQSGSVEVIDNAITLNGPDYGGCSGAAHWVKIESTIPEGINTVDFTWAYQTLDGAWYDPPQYAVNGNYVQLTQQNNATGSLSVPVVEGDVFTFRQYSVDTCCSPGRLTISNLSLWTAVVTTTSTSTTTTTTTTTSTTVAPTTTTEAPQTTTSAPQTTSSSSSSSLPQTTTTQEPTTTTSTQPQTTTTSTTTTTISFTPPTTVFVPTGTTTTIVEAPTEISLPEEDLPVSTEMPVVTDPPIELPTTIEVVPPVQDNNLVEEVLPVQVGPQLTDLLPSEPITDAVLDAIITESFTPDASAEEVSAAMDTILASDVTVAQLQSVVDAVFTEDATVEVMSAALKSLVDADLSVRELATVLNAVFDSDLSDEATIALAEQILEQPLSVEEFKTVLYAIFDEKVADEVLIATFTAVLDTPLTEERFAEVVNVLSSDAITNDQVAQVVDLVINQEGGVEPGQAVELVSSAKVLESVTGDQATEVFGAVDEGALTAENGEQITAAVQEAPVAVRNAFQEEINVFGGVFDGYYPLGSMVDVGTRRVVVAGTGVLLSAPVLASRRVRV